MISSKLKRRCGGGEPIISKATIMLLSVVVATFTFTTITLLPSTSFAFQQPQLVSVSNIAPIGIRNRCRNKNGGGRFSSVAVLLHQSPPSSSSDDSDLVSDSDSDSSMDELRLEIEEMKKKARRKLDQLDSRISTEETTVVQSTTTTADKEILVGERGDNENFVERVAVSNEQTSSSSSTAAAAASSLATPSSTLLQGRDELSLLDGTTWRLSFSVGREPGTWMPKTWGVSGERLVLSLDVEFSPEQLYEREEFLGSLGGARKLKICNNNTMTLAPTITQGTRQIKVVDGGWRVAKGQGPMGTDLLKFYVETDEEISRSGEGGENDVYCPSGRIYCSCGYFSMMPNPADVGYKDSLRKELDTMIIRAEKYDDEIAAEGPFSIKRFQLQADLFRLKVDMQRTAERYASASVAEPDKSLLRFSNDGEVGLTREGGICCKVIKSIGIEYHILGRFSIAAAREKRKD